MSLSKDQELIKQLIRIAQGVNPVPTTPAPTGITPQARTVALKLIQNLQQEAAKPASAFTSDKGDLSIKDPKVLRSLDSLLDYLNLNIIKTNGYGLVVPPNAQGKLNPDLVKYNIYFPYPKTDTGEAPKYFVYKDGLIAFIRALQKQASDSKNVIVGNLLSGLIEQVNSDFTEMSTIETEKLKAYPNDMQLDLLKQVIPFEGFGNAKLTPPDLASREALDSFLKKNKIRVSKDGKEIAVEDDPNMINDVLEFMQTRASSWANSRGSASDKAYLDLVSKLSPGQASTQAPQAPNAANTAPTQQQSVMLGNIPWPLFPDKIDIDLCTNFFKWYIAFSNVGTDVSAKSTANSFKSYQDKITQFTTRYPGVRAQLLGTEGISQIKNSIYTKSHGRETSVVPYIELLKVIVGGVASALGQLETIFQGMNSQNFKDYVSYIQEQENNYASNLNHLERLELAAQDDFRNQQAQNGR